MEKNREISVLSTWATDVLIRNGEVTSRQDGGPIMFIRDALKESGVESRLYFGERVDVEILINDEGEFGRIREIPPALVVPGDISDWVIVSTLLREWDLSGLVDRSNVNCFVDIQGYVRDGDDFGKKKVWEDVTRFADSITCLKGTKQEIEYLPADVVERQKRERMLIITDGENGIEMFDKGRRIELKVPRIVESSDTLGAGDTFFGYFVSGLYKGMESEEAAREAMEKVTTFLEKRT